MLLLLLLWELFFFCCFSVVEFALSEFVCVVAVCGVNAIVVVVVHFD